MTFVAIMAATPDNQVAKYEGFVTEAEADAHVIEHAARFPDAFTAPEPTEELSHWFINMAAKTIIIVPLPPPNFDAIDQVRVEQAFNLSGIDRVELRLIFELVKAVKTGDLTFFNSVVNPATFKELAWRLSR